MWVIASLPKALRRSLTWDQGAEMSQHAQLRIDTGVQVYFRDPHSPWQKGGIENLNGRVRRLLPRESPPEALARPCNYPHL